MWLRDRTLPNVNIDNLERGSDFRHLGEVSEISIFSMFIMVLTNGDLAFPEVHFLDFQRVTVSHLGVQSIFSNFLPRTGWTFSVGSQQRTWNYDHWLAAE